MPLALAWGLGRFAAFRFQLFANGGTLALCDFPVHRRLLSVAGVPLPCVAGFDALKALRLTLLRGSLAFVSQSLALVGRMLTLVSHVLAAIGDAIALFGQAVALLRACLVHPDTLQPRELSLLSLLLSDKPFGGALTPLLFARGRRAFALIDRTLPLVGELFTLIGNPLALVGKTGTLVRKALEPLERRFPFSLTHGSLPKLESAPAGEPLPLCQHLLALCQHLLALLRDALTLGRDALTLRR